MNKPLVLLAATGAAALTLSACGGSSNNGAVSAANSELSAIQSAESQGGAGSVPAAAPSSAIPSADLSTVDVCSLLSKADALSVAQADQLDPGATSAAAYTFKATSTPSGDYPGCRFDIYDSNDEGTVLFSAEPGSYIDEYSDGTKISGLGDEAYSNGSGGAVVRVGGVLITEGDDSFTGQITTDLLRKMAPHLR